MGRGKGSGGRGVRGAGGGRKEGRNEKSSKLN